MTPTYPENAKRLNIEGLVEVTTYVDENGNVVWACGKGNPELTASAEEAARQCKFPKNFGGATNSSGRTPVVLNFDFRLDRDRGERIEEFVWRYSGSVIGRLNVPAGFTAETYDYREGIVMTLRYNDGPRITLQSGGMFQLPIFRAPEYDLISLMDSALKTVRFGRSAGDELYWREDNYRRSAIIGENISMATSFPPNLGYSGVPAGRRSEFDEALDSFVHVNSGSRHTER